MNEKTNEKYLRVARRDDVRDPTRCGRDDDPLGKREIEREDVGHVP